jgi:hypothetical protein
MPNEAMAIRLPIVTYPDLLNSFIASRMVVAEQVQDGKLTIAQGNEILATKNSDMVAEEQRRNLANRSVNAQETASRAQETASRAALFAASKPNPSINCDSTAVGNSVWTTCN